MTGKTFLVCRGGDVCDQVLPFYLVCDQSFSTFDHIGAFDECLRELHYSVGTDPVIARRVRFCLIGYSADAEVLLPLTRLDATIRCSRLQPGAAASFGAAFRLLRVTIDRDVESLRDAWHRVSRPAVFFLSEGRATDPAGWPPAHLRLTDSSWMTRPDIVAFGTGDADPTSIARIGTVNAFLSQAGTGAAVRTFMGVVTSAILRSGVSMADGDRAGLDLPDQITGYVTIGVHRSPDPTASGRPPHGRPHRSLRSS